VSTHPFTGGPHPTDVRITTRYSSDNWLEGMAGTVHEVGHALYERVTVFDDSYHVSVERDVEISTTQIMDCCGVVLYYLVTHTITSLNILSIY
jgi:regulation of enolase protein 1 (concanavalin A-like superfamily)